MSENHLVGCDKELGDRLVVSLGVDQDLVVVIACLQYLVEEPHVPDVFQEARKAGSRQGLIGFERF